MTHDDQKNLKPANTPTAPMKSKCADNKSNELELTDQELAAIAGGLNPQPLPPGNSGGGIDRNRT